MDEEIDDVTELEIREYSDADFYPDICPFCYTSDIRSHTYKMRMI